MRSLFLGVAACAALIFLTSDANAGPLRRGQQRSVRTFSSVGVYVPSYYSTPAYSYTLPSYYSQPQVAYSSQQSSITTTNVTGIVVPSATGTPTTISANPIVVDGPQLVRPGQSSGQILPPQGSTSPGQPQGSSTDPLSEQSLKSVTIEGQTYYLLTPAQLRDLKLPKDPGNSTKPKPKLIDPLK